MKVFFGYLFYFLSVLCFLSIVGNVMRIIGSAGIDTEIGIIERFGGIIFAIILAIVFIIMGAKLTRKKTSDKEIDNIGNND